MISSQLSEILDRIEGLRNQLDAFSQQVLCEVQSLKNVVEIMHVKERLILAAVAPPTAIR